MKYPLLYEINTRCWLAELSKKAGRRLTLADIPDAEFDFWRECGFTHLWLMGAWSLGRRGPAHSKLAFGGRAEEFRRGEIVGSPYAITGHIVSRRLGGEVALAKFRRELNERGIDLILDFIPNHTALDHPWVKIHPEYYMTSDTPRASTFQPLRGMAKWFAFGHGGFGEAWADTLQLDYCNADLRHAMTRELLALTKKCDGVRCDMAMLLLNDVFAQTWRDFQIGHTAPQTEFWADAISAIRHARPDFLLLAEVYWDREAQLQQLGFDYTYDKRLYDRVIARDAAGTVAYVQSLDSRFLSRSAHFIENHDEPRIASLLTFEEHRAAALLISALAGMRLLHEGQFSGAKVHANVHFGRRVAEPIDARVADFYGRLLRALKHSAVGRGNWRLLRPHAAPLENDTTLDVILIQWQDDDGALDLAAINLAPRRSQCVAPLHLNATADEWRFTDLLSDEVHQHSAHDLAQRGLPLALPAHAAQLFHGERVRSRTSPL